jgi:hypothetical protein
VRFRKAARPATAETVNGPRTSEHAAEPLEGDATQNQPALQSVYDGRERVGHLLLRGKQGVEAFDANEVSLGIYPDLKTAADAVVSKAAAS